LTNWYTAHGKQKRQYSFATEDYCGHISIEKDL